MKVAIYIDDGIQQVVLTPENEWEKTLVKSIHQKPQEVRFHEGGFYECQGGWVRQEKVYQSMYGIDREPKSLIMVITEKKEETPS